MSRVVRKVKVLGHVHSVHSKEYHEQPLLLDEAVGLAVERYWEHVHSLEIAPQSVVEVFKAFRAAAANESEKRIRENASELSIGNMRDRRSCTRSPAAPCI